jgi:hypothetical protein
VAYKARRARARQIYRDIERQRTCELLDIALPVDDQVSDTTTVNLGLLYVNAMGGDAPAYIERWFTETYPPVSLPQSKLTDPAAGPKSEALASIAAQRVASGLQAAGVDLAGFDAFSDGSGAGELADLQDALLDMGVFASPAYVYQGERFQGRQHLPLVRWYLLGAVGTAPV